MKKNMSSTDRWIRIVLAIVLAGLYFGNIVSGTIGYILLGVAAVSLITGLLNWCGLYALLGIKTCKVEKA